MPDKQLFSGWIARRLAGTCKNATEEGWAEGEAVQVKQPKTMVRQLYLSLPLVLAGVAKQDPEGPATNGNTEVSKNQDEDPSEQWC